MILSIDRWQALRECCRDEAAFNQLRQILAAEQAAPLSAIPTHPTEAIAPLVTPTADRLPQPGAAERLSVRSPSDGSLDLMRGVAEAARQLFVGADYEPAIAQALAILGEVIGVDRVYVFQVHPHPETGEVAASQKFEWVRAGIAPQIDNPALQNRVYVTQGLMRWYALLRSGQPIRGLTREFSDREQQLLIEQGIQSVLIVPILIDNNLWGYIGFDHCQTEHHWSPDEAVALQWMAISLGGAIACQDAKVALQHSESRLQKIAANVPGMIYQFLLSPTDQSRQVLYASSGSQELLEYSPEEVQADASRIANLCHPDDRESFEQSILQSALTLQAWNWEGRIITPSGKLKWVQGVSRPELQPNGDLLWDGVLVDVTDRKQAEAESRQSEARYRAMLDASPDLMFRISRDGKYLDCKGTTPAAIDKTAIVGRYMHELLPPDLTELSATTVEHVLATGELKVVEYQLLQVTGEIRSYEARIVVSGADEVLTVVRDVTERKQIEAELRASEERLQSFFNATFEAVVIHDADQILDVNPAAERLFGYAATDLVGMPLINLTAPEAQDQVRAVWDSLRSPQDAYSYEALNIRQDGSLFIATVCAKAVQYRGQWVRVAGIRDVTESRQAEAAIRQSEARHRALVEAIPDLMFRIHRDGTYLDCKIEKDSDALFSATEMVGKTIYEVLPPNLADQRMAYVERALTTGAIQRFEYQLDWRPSAHAAVLRQQLGQSQGEHEVDVPLLRDYEMRIVVSGEDEVLAIVRDITERNQAEAALRLSEEKFSKAFRSSPNPITITTLQEGRLLEVNDSFLEVSGYQREEVIGRSVFDIHLWENPGDRDMVLHQLQQDGVVSNMECCFRMRAGKTLVGLFSAEVIYIGGQACMLAITVDITKRKQAEQQLRAAAERDRVLGEIALRIRQSLNLDEILHNTAVEVRRFLQADRVTISYFEPTGEGQVVAESVDPRFAAAIGWVTEDDVYQEVKALFAQTRLCVVNDTTEDEWSPFFLEYFQRYEVKAAMGVPIEVGDRLFGVLVAHQCTATREWQPFEISLLDQLATQVSIAIQQAQLYRQVQDLNAGLEQQVQERTAELQQKMQELQDLNQLKDEFLNAFSHDLKTPVMGMSLVLKNMLNQAGDSFTMTRPIVERMLQSSDHQLHLITALLQAHASETRGVTLNYELVQLSLLVQIIVEDLEPLVAKNQATLTSQVPSDLPLVTADPVHLRRVFENLLTNALNHNPPGVNLTLAATVEEEMIRFTVQDDGLGISQEVCDRLFSRYVRGPKSRHSSGIGLGLYLCRQIVTAHGGQIGVNSEPGMGSTFWLTLPLAIPSTAQTDPNALAEA